MANKMNIPLLKVFQNSAIYLLTIIHLIKLIYINKYYIILHLLLFIDVILDYFCMKKLIFYLYSFLHTNQYLKLLDF